MSRNRTARFAGLTYLILVVTGIFNLLYVPSKLIDWESASTTANNIQNSEFLFRSSIVAGVISYISFLILPFVLFELLESVNRAHALLMVVLAAFSVPVSLFNMVNKVDVLTLLSGAKYLDAFEVEQIHTQVMLSLKSYNNGISIVQIFWGLWLFPFGYLVFKSGFLPRIFGVLLMFGCFGYLKSFFSYLLFPAVELPAFLDVPGTLGGVGEIGICLWLLIMGVKGDENQLPGG